MYDLNINIDGESLSSRNISVDGSYFFGCVSSESVEGYRPVMGYWEDDFLSILVAKESSEGGCQVAQNELFDGNVYMFQEYGSGTLDGSNSFGVSGERVDAYVSELIVDGDEVSFDDSTFMPVNAIVSLVPHAAMESEPVEVMNIQPEDAGVRDEDEDEVAHWFGDGQQPGQDNQSAVSDVTVTESSVTSEEQLASGSVEQTETTVVGSPDSSTNGLIDTSDVQEGVVQGVEDGPSQQRDTSSTGESVPGVEGVTGQEQQNK